MQDVSKRVDLAFKRYIKGDCNGTRSGKPRFKSRYRTIRLEGQAIKIVRVEKNWLYLTCSKLKGWLKVRLHRPKPVGFSLKNMLITKKADGWYVNTARVKKNIIVGEDKALMQTPLKLPLNSP